MAEAFISAVIGDMVSRAISIVISRSTRQESINAKLTRIRHMLIKIGSAVEEAKGRQITNHGTLEWLSELISGMYQGRYFLDISKDGSQNLVDVNDNKDVPYPFLLSSFNHAKRLRISASSIKIQFSKDDSILEINNVLANLQSLSVGIREFVVLLDCCPPILKPLRTNLYVDCEMFGRHVERERVINFLLHKGNPSERKLDILPIIGNVGVGKTTLVQHVCDDARVRSHFSSILLSDFFTLTVMENSETRIVLNSKYSTGDFGNFNDLLQTFKHKLNNKRFLMVFENVDSEKKQMLQVLLSNLRSCKQGSKVIVTSPHNHTASVIGTVQPIKLSILPCEKFWFYFKALAFPDADFEENFPRMAAIGMAIAKKLNGSFFGAKIIGALLKVHPNIQFWSEALRSSIWDLPVLGSSLPYISDVANYFLSRQVSMCHVNMHTSKTYFRKQRTLYVTRCLYPESSHWEEENIR
ncbi:hypothetical protein GQ55_3G394600 [Panicum hallii var. hallii]|uniref:NB-ARC domain-containing protein n=1 Tax=Panicum hallii var. hallii TaxID=1504633 RepID=A0A2T7EGN8_9POAL|nr:hypothetical protein GQ55_3G394600 [Panicum hallii var. hallii]